uniref:hypothetical protein n=1 Tax=Microbispora cellulosiformans TaxID=2614688 RepID=UPI00177CA9EF|nr:hypothetical protein [Microbispora cellulosiformans]
MSHASRALRASLTRRRGHLITAAILLVRRCDRVYQLGLDHGVDLANTFHHAGV